MKVSAARFVGAVALSTLLVPAPAPAAAPAGRYTFPSTGVVHDSKTGLNWQQATAPGTYTWAEALMYCSTTLGATLGGTWRLPAVKELQTLVDDSVATPGPTIDGSAFPATPNSWFWSSTPVASSASSHAWSVFFNYGYPERQTVSFATYVRCVR